MSDNQEDYSEDQGETYIDPNDLNIINNPNNWEPTDEQIIAYAHQLKFDVDNDPQEFLEIAYTYLTNPLPPTMRRAFRKDNGEVLYIDTTTNEIHLETEIEKMAMQEYRQYKKDYEQKLREEEEAKKKVTVVPRKKIPPIGGTKPIEDKNQKKEKEFMNNLKKEQEIEEMKVKEREMSEIKKKIARQKEEDGEKEKEKSKTKEEVIVEVIDDDNEEVVEPPQRKSYNSKERIREKKQEESYKESILDMDKDNANDDDSYEERKPKRESRRHQPEVYVDEVKQSQYTKEKQMEEKHKERNNKDPIPNQPSNHFLDLNIEQDNDDDNDNNDNDNDKDNNDNDNDSSKASIPHNPYTTPERLPKPSLPIPDSTNSATLKLNHLTSSQASLQQFKQSLDTQFESFLSTLTISQSEAYERNLLREKRKLKDQHEKDHKSLLRTLELNHESAYANALNSYQLTLKNSDASIETYDDDLAELLKEKTSLQHSIQIQRDNNKIQRERRLQSRKAQLTQARYISEQKLKIQKEAMLLKHRKETTDKENDYEQSLRQQRDMMPMFNPSASINASGSILGASTMVDYKAILDEYQKMLDEMYTAKTVEIRREFERNKERDLEEFRLVSVNESQDKISLANKEIGSLEKEYYDDLQFIRQQSKVYKERHAKEVNERLTGTAMDFEAIKLRNMKEMEEALKEIISLLHEQIRTTKDYDGIDYLEGKCEEVIGLKMNEAHVVYRKRRTLYEMTEKDFKQKHLLLMYFADLAYYLTKKLIERPITGQSIIEGIDDVIVEDIMTFGRNKMSEYRLKYINMKDIRLFAFLDGFNGMTGLNKQHYSHSPYFQQSMQFMTGSFDQQANHNLNLNLNNTYVNPIQSQSFSSPQVMPITNQSHSNSNTIRVLPLNSYRETNTDRYPLQVNEDIMNQSAHFPNKEEQQSQLQLQFQKQQQQPQQTQQSSISLSLTLPQEIISKLTDEEFLLYSNIIDFLRDESTFLIKEQTILNHQHQLSDQLSQINSNGDLLQYSHVFNEKKMKWLSKDKAYRNKSELFSIIKQHIEDVFSFIISNSSRTNVFIDKMKSILKHVNDYKGIEQAPKFNDESMLKQSKCNCDCMRQSMTLPLNAASVGEMNTSAVENSFRNFYTLYKPSTLSGRMNTNFSHEFFTFKKHCGYASHKSY